MIKLPLHFRFVSSILRLSFWGLVLLCSSAKPIWAYEISVTPSLNLEEPKKGSFVLERSWLSTERDIRPDLTLSLGLGSDDLSRPAIWFKEETNQFWGAHSFYAESKFPWLDLRFGFIPIAQTFEGSLDENELQMPDTRARRQNWFIRRDLGIELRSHFNEWQGRWSIHNGESKPDRDSQLWFSGLWQYKNSEGVGVQITAFVGRTSATETAKVTSGANTLGFVFDPNSNSKIRHAGISFFKIWNQNIVLAEIGRGEILQSDEKQSFVWGHFDICYDLGEGMSFLTRYEHDQPNGRESLSATKSFGLGFQWKLSGPNLRRSEERSRWQFWAQKNAQKTDVADDQVQISYSFFAPEN